MDPKDILTPDRIFSNLLNDYMKGRLGSGPVLYRAVVVKVDQIGGALHPNNPKNSIQARVVTHGMNTHRNSEDLPVFWPLFSHEIMPVKETEHVYVLFEDETMEHGLWIARIPEPLTADSKNLTPGSKKFLDNPDNELSAVAAEKMSQDLDVDPEPIEVSPEFVAEEVPPFTARIGDYVIHGSNNTLIVMGRDRPTNAGSGEQTEAGTIDLVAGRSTPEDMNLGTDKSRIYVTMKSDVDGGFGINIGEAAGPTAAVVVKSDQIRIVARNGMKLIVEGGNIQIDAQQILLGGTAEEPAMKGNTFAQQIGPLLDALAAPAIGALGQVPIPPAPAVASAATALKTALVEGQILSSKNKVE